MKTTGNRLRIVYSSESVSEVRLSDLQVLLEKSRINNAKLGISGLLVYRACEFFQILEGERSSVDALYDAIRVDARHQNVHLLARQEDADFHFEDWSMGYIHLEQPTSPEFSDVLSKRFLRELRGDSTRVKRMISQFSNGEWRRRIC